jgi:hypothetical protein
MQMQKFATILITAAAAIALASCSTSGANPPSVPNVANLNANVLQLNVGTANLFADTPGAAVVGTNVAVTYRQPAGATNPGASAVLVSSPSLLFPAALPVHTLLAPDQFGATVLSGAAAGETTTMTSIPQTPNAAGATTFGNDGGAFGLGLEPFNYVAPLGQAGVTGKPASIVPYPVPLYDALVNGGAVDPNQFTPAGGPPAFPTSNNTAATIGASFTGHALIGISEGLDVFAVPPVAGGSYTLSVSVPGNTGTVVQSQTAKITSITPPNLLPAFAGPPAPVVTFTGPTAGTVTSTVALPVPGVTEVYVQLVDYGPTAAGAASCVGATAATPIYYTYVLKASGTATFPSAVCTAQQNAALAANAGIATDGDAFTTQAIGFDYPAYEASYPSSLGVVSPSLKGSGPNSQADVTVSSKGVFNLPIPGSVLVPLPAAVEPTGAADPQPESVRRSG